MNQDVLAFGATAFLVLCRIGTSLMFIPGLSSARIPLSLRLFCALALSLALTPQVVQFGLTGPVEWRSRSFFNLVFQEFFLGFLFGTISSLTIQAARFAGDTISSSIGLAGIPGQPIELNEASSQVSSLITLAVTMLLFAGDLHLLSIDAILRSYELVKIGAGYDVRDFSEAFLRQLRDLYLLSLQVASPFIAYSLLGNLMLGLIGRIAPKVSIYFTLTGAITIGGLLLLAASFRHSLEQYAQHHKSWLLWIAE